MNKKDKNTKSVSIRMPIKLWQDLHYVSDYEGRSLNGQVLYLIRQCIKEFKDKNNDV